MGLGSDGNGVVYGDAMNVCSHSQLGGEAARVYGDAMASGIRHQHRLDRSRRDSVRAPSSLKCRELVASNKS